MESQAIRAVRFRALHEGPPILVLPNAWDAASARIFEMAGFHAIGTTSAGIAASLGFSDGQRVPREAMLDAVRRISAAVSIPVTADMESGFGETLEELVDTVHAVIGTGAVGMNLEDAAREELSALADIGRHVERIQAIRQAADALKVPLVINARTDVYLRGIGEPESRFEHAGRRARAYLQAGAGCAFVPGVRDPETIRRLCSAIDGPVNILAVPGAPPIAELQQLGVRRVSVGSGPMRATMALTERIARELIDKGTYATFSDALPYADVNRMFEDH